MIDYIGPLLPTAPSPKSMSLIFLLCIFFFSSLLQLASASEHHQVVKNLVIKEEQEDEGSSKDRLTKRQEGGSLSITAAHSKLSLPPQLTVSFSAYDKQFTLKLRRTETLLAPDFHIVLLDEQGKEQQEQQESLTGHPYSAIQIISNTDNEPITDPFARFHVQKAANGDFEVQGSFEWKGALFRLRPGYHPAAIKETSLLKSSQNDLIVSREWMDERRLLEKGAFGSGFLAAKNATVAFKCGHDLLQFNQNPMNDFIERVKEADQTQQQQTQTQPSKLSQLLPQRQNHQALMALFDKRADKATAKKEKAGKVSTVAAGCPSDRKSLYIGIAADSLYLKKFEGNRQRAIANILADFNLVSAIYERNFNVELGIVTIVLLDSSTAQANIPWNLPCTAENDIGRRLNEFSKWRSTQSKSIGKPVQRNMYKN